MNFLDKYLPLIEKSILDYSFTEKPVHLYEPMNYILNLGGKRLRPILTIMSCELFDGDTNKAIKPALGIEYFHNFSLMHDDIMDQAPLRRNKETVHIKYNTNTAILSGDALLIKSYQMIEDLPPETFKKCTVLFSKTAQCLCEGQQYDINFETEKEVSFDNYIQMITGKTAVLCACALKMGAEIAKADETDAEHIYNFGKYLGIAFQLKDDFLDVFGNQELVGKKQSGDICENKKTILYILAMQNAENTQKKELEKWYSIKEENQEKIDQVYSIFKSLKIDEYCLSYINKFHDKAKEELKKINVSENKKTPFFELMEYLLKREN